MAQVDASDRRESGAIQIVQFKSADVQSIATLGLSQAAVTEIMLGPSDAPAPRTRPQCPAWASAFIKREFSAAEFAFRWLERGRMLAPHPRSGELVESSYTFLVSADTAIGYVLFNVFGKGDDSFCLVFRNLSSRVTNIILPADKCIIYDLDAGTAPLIWDAFVANDPAHRNAPSPVGIVGVVSMVTNFAHQAMNHLSGLQRLVDNGLHEKLDEIWVSGTEFYGRTERIFPELKGRIRRMELKEIPARLRQTNLSAFNIGSNFVTASLHQRLAALGVADYPCPPRASGRFPLLAFTIRSEGRCCNNLAEAIEQITRALLPVYPNLGVVLDGWVFPETAIIACSNVVTSTSNEYAARIRKESELCQNIASRLPPGVLVRNFVGTTVLESIMGLQNIDAYVAHVGTLQHKLGWFTKSAGVVHGPTVELERYESGYSASQWGYPPAFVPKDDIRDIPIDTPRGEGFYDYELRNTTSIVSKLQEMLSQPAG